MFVFGWGTIGILIVVYQGCRFVPKQTFSDTIRHRWYQADSRVFRVWPWFGLQLSSWYHFSRSTWTLFHFLGLVHFEAKVPFFLKRHALKALLVAPTTPACPIIGARVTSNSAVAFSLVHCPTRLFFVFWTHLYINTSACISISRHAGLPASQATIIRSRFLDHVWYETTYIWHSLHVLTFFLIRGFRVTGTPVYEYLVQVYVSLHSFGWECPGFQLNLKAYSSKYSSFHW